jgi:Na+-transporting methylmalonyl-CoA/oxaloacetate decarboxylase gamma subunit
MFGMGTVLVFLSILIVVTQAMSAIILRIDVTDVAGQSGRTPVVSPTLTSQNIDRDPRTRAIVQSAIDLYRANH